jgi:hypothetical protein
MTREIFLKRPNETIEISTEPISSSWIPPTDTPKADETGRQVTQLAEENGWFASGQLSPLSMQASTSDSKLGITASPISPLPLNTLLRGTIRQYDTGATRDTDEGKLNYEGFISPLALKRFAEYMHEHRRQSDGTMRAADNWQKGIPLQDYMESGCRHFVDWWLQHRGIPGNEEIEEALCALWFNVQGYLHELLTEQRRA